MYYTRAEKLVSLDVLKLYCGEDVIFQDPENMDPGQWLDESKLMELPEAPLGEVEMISREPSVDRRDPEIPTQPDIEIQVIHKDPQEICL